jgi:hypothetical protein
VDRGTETKAVVGPGKVKCPPRTWERSAGTAGGQGSGSEEPGGEAIGSGGTTRLEKNSTQGFAAKATPIARQFRLHSSGYLPSPPHR